uniref:nuclear exosome regulator NRDE2 n=1 Tax=Erigeron canadensis TaxID=72917 RepID=UPI001CB98131|nr:nuclear exosome regulator NRDE2 [Erigeron canadensis]
MADESPPGDSLLRPPSLFPIFNQNPTDPINPHPPLQLSNPTTAPPPNWLSNTSFTVDISTITPPPLQSHQPEPEEEQEDEKEVELVEQERQNRQTRYELVESSESDQELDEKRKRRKKDKKKKKNKKEKKDVEYGPNSRKQNIQSWAASNDSIRDKEYYFDSRGDRDNLAFGSLYRMDVARYKIFNGSKSSGLNYNAFHSSNMRSWDLGGDNDVNSLDNKLRSEGRYWSAKHAALEHHKNFKRLRVVGPKGSQQEIGTDFIPLSDETTPVEGQPKDLSVVEESWEDEVLRKTKEFNKMTREHPYNENFWLEFANFQDKVESKQRQRGARLQTLEKKISILEKASELNPDNEELLLALMNAYQRRDNNDVLIARWEKLLTYHSGSYKLWREFLRLVQGDFSRFKVSEVRKMFANGIQALSAACNKQHRQARQNDRSSPDPLLVQQELGLVSIFVSLCRFEWQSGYQELATALFQAVLEYTLFCPSLLLSEQSKQRLFEYFWNSIGARIGEDGALGWSNWLQKEEEQKQMAMMKESESSSIVDEGGWTGWHEPKGESNAHNEDNLEVADVGMEVGNDDDDVDMEEKDDTEALMKLLGINGETEANGEVQDVSTWVRWSKEELLRDSNQWMPLRTKFGTSLSDGLTDEEGGEQLLRAVLFEDISEYLFSITTDEVRLSLVYEFIDFFGGITPQWSSTNSSSWAEGTLMMEWLPHSMQDDLRKVEEILKKADGCLNGYSLEHVLGSFDNINMRSEMMKFVRNVTLQCLNAFSSDHILKEVALVAEELSKTRMNSCSVAVTPCRPLAKNLIKSNRQDVHLCGVYARREAAFGNIEYARKAFDMALFSIEGFPWDVKSNASLLYLWYAEAELTDKSSKSSESLPRALHILCCLGCGLKYSPFKSQPSNLQLLRARQGFREQIRMIQATWIRGTIDDNSVASICSAALFEELTTGMEAAVEVLNQALSTVLPERRSQNHQLELLFNFYVRLLCKHSSQSELATIWKFVVQGLQIYPFSPKLYNSIIRIAHLHTSPSKLRWIIDDYLHKKPSVILCLFALSYETSRGSSHHRVHRIFERALMDNKLRFSVLLWRLYIDYEIHVTCDLPAARRIYFRAIHTCPWSKKLWLDGFTKLSSVLTAKELSDLLEVMRDKELNVRTDVYEILLQDEMDMS